MRPAPPSAPGRAAEAFSQGTTAVHADAHDRLALAAQLPGAIERGELRLRYLPRVDAPSGRATSVEATIEWLHPTLGFLAPKAWATFDELPGATPRAALDSAFAWALTTACAHQQCWRDHGLSEPMVALRVPPRQVLDAAFAAAVEHGRHSVSWVPGTIELELAEPALAGAGDETLAALQRLKSAGCTFSVGSFGTGRSSLDALHRLPIDALRIDASLVRALQPGPRDDDHAARPAAGMALVRAIVELGRALGLRVGAQGVDHPEQEAALLAAGCDELQGGLYGEPMAPDACAAWLRQHGDMRTAAVLVDC